MIDISGHKYHKVTVLEYSFSKEKKTFWKCRCDCGKEFITTSNRLRTGGTKSCGCLKEKEDLSGQRFGKLLVLGFSHKRDSTRFYWKCRCDCGKEVIKRADALRSGKTISCGCISNLLRTKASTKHGKHKDRVYNIYKGIKQRCYNKNNAAFPHYGGRGILMCDRWKDSFENFYSDMGDPPTDKHQIDRINNEDVYSPENCHWTTADVQSKNKRNTRLITYQGKTQCLKDWSKELGINYLTLCYRIKHNFDMDSLFKETKRR